MKKKHLITFLVVDFLFVVGLVLVIVKYKG
jgi:hypothetical protein